MKSAVDRKEFEKIHSEFVDKENLREILIKKSRKIVNLSKQIIYSLHREEYSNATKLVRDIKNEMKGIKNIAERLPLDSSGSYKIAAQEYVEALSFYYLIKTKKIRGHKYLGVESEFYLLGLCDLVGELNRAAVNSVIRGKFEMAGFYKQSVEELYGIFLKFDFRNSELRKKFDGMKYELKKLENLMLELKLRKNHGQGICKG
jgi:translin